jgi:hypothetical protein
VAAKRPTLTFSTTPKASATPPVAGNDAERTFLAARVPTPLLRQFKSFAAERGRKVHHVIEEAMTEYLANHRLGSFTLDLICQGKGLSEFFRLSSPPANGRWNGLFAWDEVSGVKHGGKSTLTDDAAEQAALRALSKSEQRGEADRARAIPGLRRGRLC